MKLVLITGMSGAGKSVALKTLEDAGFEAIDNIPLTFLPDIAASGARVRNLAVASDVRSRDFSVEHFLKTIEPLKQNPDVEFTLLFLDSDDEVLRRRYTETRRRHPLGEDRTVMDGIINERQLIEKLRAAADVVVDTSEIEPAEFRNILHSHFSEKPQALSLIISSFSFKRGVPRDADMVFDVRFLKNPHYDPALKAMTGQAPAVGKYIESDEGFADFFARLTAYIEPLLPRFRAEGKHYLTIAIGCTGGKHRSVYVAEKLAHTLRANGHESTIRHRDMEQDL